MVQTTEAGKGKINNELEHVTAFLKKKRKVSNVSAIL